MTLEERFHSVWGNKSAMLRTSITGQALYINRLLWSLLLCLGLTCDLGLTGCGGGGGSSSPSSQKQPQPLLQALRAQGLVRIIMPLGDSNTFGIFIPGAYRCGLHSAGDMASRQRQRAPV